jgi:hypothetical protein
MRRRVLSAIALATVSACMGSSPAPDTTCAPTPLAGPALGPDQLVRLAGEYELVLVNTRGEYGDSVSRGLLTLWPNDSARRFAWVSPEVGRIPGERPLVGRFVSRSPTIPSYPNQWESATPDRPVVEVIGTTLYFGGIDMMDGGGERLAIRTASATGFTGVWHHDGRRPFLRRAA